MQQLRSSVPILGLAATSGTGKTTLLEKLIPKLTSLNIRVAVIKHSHHDFEIDTPGKDSYRIRQAGAQQLLIVSPYRRVLITEVHDEADRTEPTLQQQLDIIDTDNIDLILIEGFRTLAFPKIELHRTELKRPLLCLDDPDIIAVASDETPDLPEGLEALQIDSPDQIACFIYQWMKEQQGQANIPNDQPK